MTCVAGFSFQGCKIWQSVYDSPMHPRAQELIRTLDLEPHPEGGFYKRIYEASKQVEVNGLLRPTITSICFLLTPGAPSKWHRIDAIEVWNWQEGSAMELLMYATPAQSLSRTQLDTSARGGQIVQSVPANTWQTARTHGDFTLVHCSVSPGFMWSALEMLDESSELADELRAAGGIAA